MTQTRRYRLPGAAIAALTILHFSASARAQQPLPPGSAAQPQPPPSQPLPAGQPTPGQPAPGQPPPAQPPPGYAPPPPGYAPPPPGYGQPPPGYGQPPPPGYGPPPGYPPYGYGPPPGYSNPYGYGAPPPEAYGPKTREYKEGEPIPPGYHLETRGQKAIIIAGVAVFGGLYVVSALVGGTFLSEGGDSADALGPLLIPVVGPFVTIGTSELEGGNQGDQGPIILLLLDGLGQTAGVALTIIGLASGDTKTLVRNDQGYERVFAPEVLVGAGSAGLRWRF